MALTFGHVTEDTSSSPVFSRHQAPTRIVDPLHSMQVQFFSNAFSNAGDYVRSRPNVCEMKERYSNRLRSRASVSELEKGRWHARGQGFESPYLHPYLHHKRLIS